MQTLSATLAGTNTAKILDLLGSTSGVDLPSKDEEDDVEVESVSEEEEEEHLPQTGLTSHVAAKSADSAKFSTTMQSPSTSQKQPAPKIKGQSKQHKEERPEAELEFGIKPLNEAEVYYPEKRVSYLKMGVPKKFISQCIKQGSKGVYECHYQHAPEC